MEITRAFIEGEKKAHDEQKCSIDRISNLPNDVLYHLLSLLPVKYTARTSVLSRRWRYLWTSVPVLDFCEGFTSDVDDTKRMQFITTVLTRRQENSNIKVLRIAGEESGDTSFQFLHDCIRWVVQHNQVEEIVLYLKIVNGRGNDISMATTCVAVNLLCGLSHVQQLVLSIDAFQVLSRIYFEDGLPNSFVKLQTLEIQTEGFGKREIPGLTCLFKSSPIPHTLKIDISNGSDHNDVWNNSLLEISLKYTLIP